MPHAKGTNLDNLRAYVLARHGPDAYEQVLSMFPSQEQQELRSLVSTAWYDFAFESRMLRAIDATLGTGDLGLIDDIANFVVDRDVNGIHRLFMRVANPGYLLTRCGAYWSRFYDCGNWRVLRHSSTSATGILCGFDAADEAFCRFLKAYILRLFVLAGARNAELEHTKCRSKGALECVFSGRWG